jgi:TolB-like protein/DNA-binding winged helix-turn-helix (wHTH) protein/Flp pilus assembly protein TadD
MDAGDLDRGFRLGDWLVEPRHSRISGNGVSHTVSSHQLRILQALAEHHGEIVEKSVLRERAWPGEPSSDEMLRSTMRELRRLLRDSPKDPRYIVRVAQRGYALIAHFEPLGDPAAAQPALSPGAVVIRSPLLGRLPQLFSEMRRRSVFKVLGAYLVGMWVMLQVAETTFQPLMFPDWWLTALTILAVVGIPIVGMLAWSYEITPAGIELDSGDTARMALPRARRAIAPWLVAGVAMMMGVTGFAWWQTIAESKGQAPVTASAAEPATASVAVLPLVDMTPGGGNQYLGDGFAEEISAQLAQVPGLRVAARTSAFEFKDKSLDVRRIGEALGVRNVLEGSVRRDGDKLRVTVQLIDAKNGYHVWAGTYDRNWSDVIEIQDSISRAIAQKLEVVLTPESERKLNRGDTVNLAAYETYLAATSLLHKSNDLSQLNRAAELFREALRLDPAFSRAYAGLCEVGTRRYDRTHDARDIADAETACRRAIELDPSRDETEMALATLYLTGGRNEQAEGLYRGLLARRPEDADMHIGLALALEGQARREDAEREYAAAVKAEPGYAGAHKALGNFMFRSGRTEEAIAAYHRNVELVPGSASAYSNLGAALMLANRFAESAPAFEKSIAIEPSRAAHANLGTLYYYLGRYPDAAREYEKARALAASDHGLAGSMGDALWLIPGRRPEAVEMYRQAIQLAQEALKVNPSDAATWAQLAYFSGRVGNVQEAARAEARALAIGSDDMYVYYFLALAAADRGDAAASVAAIGQAQKFGYPRKLLEADPILKSMLPRNRA